MVNKKKREKKKRHGTPSAACLDGIGTTGQERQKSISRSTLYDEYKRATTSFKEGLAVLFPSLGTKVRDLVIAVDALAAGAEKTVSPTLLGTLQSAVCIRQRVALLFGKDDADPGHEYMILVLKYCYQRLKPLARIERPADCGPVKASEGNNENSNPSLSNSFQALSTEDELFADIAIDQWDEQHVDRPEEPEIVYTIEDLIEGSDYFVAMAFLGVVDTLLDEVAAAYANLKGISRQSVDSRENKLGFELMKCAVVANSAIQELKYAEQVFVAERPHLNSIYRILAAAALPSIISFVISHMDGEGEEHEKRKAATRFVGDNLLMAFRGQVPEEGDHDFFKRWKILPHVACRMTYLTHGLLCLEIGACDQDMLQETLDLSIEAAYVNENGEKVVAAMKPDSWILNVKQLSGERSIVRTMFAIDNFLVTSQFHSGKVIYSDEAEFSWPSESEGPVTTKSLAKTFIAPVLAEICDKCGNGSLKYSLPFEEQLFPILQVFREFCLLKQSDDKVPLIFIFTIQMLQIAVIELQGDNDLQKLSLSGKLSLSRFFADLDRLVDRPGSYFSQCFNVKAFMEDGCCTANRILATEGEQPCGKGSLDLAIYNPSFSGMTILYTVYAENLNSGYNCLQIVSQLTASLHLLHALQERGGTPRDFALLKQLDKLFGQSKSVWAVQPRPSRGDFAKHFWLAVGMRPDVATRLASETSLSLLTQDGIVLTQKSYSDFRKSISSGSIENEVPIVNSSHSYRCLLLSDFLSKTPANDDSDWLCQFRQRVSESLSSIDEDKELLSFNMFCVAADLFDFVHALKDKIVDFDCEMGETGVQVAVSVLLSAFDIISELDKVHFDGKMSPFSVLAHSFPSDRTLEEYEFFV